MKNMLNEFSDMVVQKWGSSCEIYMKFGSVVVAIISIKVPVVGKCTFQCY